MQLFLKTIEKSSMLFGAAWRIRLLLGYRLFRYKANSAGRCHINSAVCFFNGIFVCTALGDHNALKFGMQSDAIIQNCLGAVFGQLLIILMGAVGVGMSLNGDFFDKYRAVFRRNGVGIRVNDFFQTRFTFVGKLVAIIIKQNGGVHGYGATFVFGDFDAGSERFVQFVEDL